MTAESLSQETTTAASPRKVDDRSRRLEAAVAITSILTILGFLASAWIFWSGPPGGIVAAILMLLGAFVVAGATSWLLWGDWEKMVRTQNASETREAAGNKMQQWNLISYLAVFAALVMAILFIGITLRGSYPEARQLSAAIGSFATAALLWGASIAKLTGKRGEYLLRSDV